MFTYLVSFAVLASLVWCGWHWYMERNIMTNKPKIDPGDEWLLSDGQLWGRTTQQPNKKGILLTVQMPDGESLQAQIEKLSAASVTQFCDFVRGTYHERKAEQAAKKARAASMRDVKPSGTTSIIQGREANLSPLDLSPERILSRIHSLDEEISSLKECLYRAATERGQLSKILEVLDAPENNAKEPACVSPEEVSVSDGSSSVVESPRKTSPLIGRETGIGSEDEGISN